MVVDTSAFVAVVRAEPEARTFLEHMAGAPLCRISAACYVETGMVLSRDRTGMARRAFEALIALHRMVIEPVSAEQAILALEAFDRFGKGRHRAGLNYGDCFAYALAKASSEPLLFKGSDFSHTDVMSV